MINNVPLSAHKNSYLIKLIIPLNKTGLLPRPANFPNEVDPLVENLLIICVIYLFDSWDTEYHSTGDT